MSRKSSWWLRPQRKGASNRAALNESKYFMEHNKVLRERIKELADENAKLREYAESYAKAVECEGCGWCPYDIDAMCNPETMLMRDGCRLYDELRELGIEVK